MEAKGAADGLLWLFDCGVIDRLCDRLTAVLISSVLD